MPLEPRDPRDAGQLRSIERSVGHGDKLGADPVPSVGLNQPAAAVVIPAHRLHPGLEACVRVEVVVTGDGLAMRKDLRRERVFVFGDIVQLLQ